MPHVILFVDDEPDVLAILRRTFASDPYEVLTAPSGPLALKTLAERQVDLLVTDQRMPGMSGVELVEAAHRLDPDLCAILLTAYTDPRDIVDAINRGQVWRYLVKPWEKADLRATVLRALEQVDLRRERTRLQAEVERRLEALQAASEVAREVGGAESPARILERVVERLPRIVRCDVAAVIVAVPGGPPDLLIRPCAHLSDAALLAVKEDALRAFREHVGAEPPEGEVRVRVTGDTAGDAPVGPFASRLTLPVHVDGASVGAVLLESVRVESFGEGDARVLDVLVNEVAQSIGVLGARLAAERERLERVVECLADGLVYVRAGSDELLLNPAARRMLGAPAGARLGLPWLAGVLGFEPFGLARELEGDPAGRASLGRELACGGRVLAAVLSPVVERSGRLAGVAVALRDVTEQKELAERKEEFVQVVSHELRTPLTSIAGALDLVLGGLAGSLEEKQAHFLKMARESSDKLNQMVDELLDVARLSKGKLRMEPGAVALDELARTAVERYQAAAADRRQTLRVETTGGIRLVADGGRLGQVLANLLTNAVKYTPEGGEIRVRVFRSPAVPGAAGLSVWNSGDGIPAADLERIFEKFEQARSERTRHLRGTGLGLAICKGIVEAHGGAIWAESAPGEGARFQVVLPERPPEGAAERPPPPADALAALVVDEPDSAAILCGVLRARGLRCASAVNADGALALARTAPPRVIVWDPLAPALDGVPLADILRHDADTRRAVLLAFSAPEGREGAFRGGADDHLAKPATEAALGEAVEALARRGRQGGARVLVLDDDPSIRAICAEVLRSQGYDVLEAGSCAEARRLVLERRPQLALVDVQLPDGDGFSLLESLAEQRAREPFGAVFLSARGETADKVRGLRLGADDYLTKPFDAQELVARVDAVLRRREATLTASPMTSLPGGRVIDREVERRLEARVPFALSYVDLDNLKAYNDTYGYAKADGVVLQTAGILRDAVARSGGEGAFLGHVGGDDFVILTPPDRAARVGGEVIAAFDRVIPLYYDRADRARGSIEAVDRFGTLRAFPLLSISIATVVATPGRFARHADLSRSAAELKERAKRMKGSVHLSDDGAGTGPR